MNTSLALAELAHETVWVAGAAADRVLRQLAELELCLARDATADPLSALGADLFASGGKRLRAAAALAVSNALDVGGERALELACAVETTHAASLLHDDVIDEADERRGHIAARRRWSNTLSILGGDHLLLEGLRRVVDLGSQAVVQAHLCTLEELLGAEVAQHLARWSGDLSVEGYLAVAEGKTGSLFGFACSAPALLLQDSAKASALDRFGRCFGVAFQIADDLHDLAATDPTKPSRLDLADGVMTLPLRLAAASSEAVRQALLAATRSAPGPHEIGDLGRRVRATRGPAEAIAIGRRYRAQSQDALDALGLTRGLEPLEAVGVWLDRELSRTEEILT